MFRGVFIGRTDVYGRPIREGDMVMIVGSAKKGLPARVRYNKYICAFILSRIGYRDIMFNEESEYEVVEDES